MVEKRWKAYIKLKGKTHEQKYGGVEGHRMVRIWKIILITWKGENTQQILIVEKADGTWV